MVVISWFINQETSLGPILQRKISSDFTIFFAPRLPFHPPMNDLTYFEYISPCPWLVYTPHLKNITNFRRNSQLQTFPNKIQVPIWFVLHPTRYLYSYVIHIGIPMLYIYIHYNIYIMYIKWFEKSPNVSNVHPFLQEILEKGLKVKEYELRKKNFARNGSFGFGITVAWLIAIQAEV